jgi:hypothetical protein
MCRKNLIVLILCGMVSIFGGFFFAQMLISFFHIVDKILMAFVFVLSIAVIFLFTVPILDRFTD